MLASGRAAHLISSGVKSELGESQMVCVSVCVVRVAFSFECIRHYRQCRKGFGKKSLTPSSLATVSRSLPPTSDPMKSVSSTCRGEQQSRRRAQFLFLFCFFLLIGKTICPNLQRAASRHLASIYSLKRAGRPLASAHTPARLCVFVSCASRC